MKTVKYLFLLAGIAMLLPLSALAKDSNEGKFTISEPVQVGSTQLKPGDYKVQWDGSGDAVQVKILQGKKTVATTSGKLVNREQAAPYNSVILKNANSGKSINEIDFSNRKEALVLTDNAMSSGQ
ncbi:MAG TPA: hypothetical protein VJQ82_08685 [Terriglobales bacterium]|nr:hypothetical protein [Terriglobales bacterium]